MILNPVRLYKRHQRLRQEAADEAQMLLRRHGDTALQAARDKLAREDLSSWGKKLLQETVKILEKAI